MDPYSSHSTYHSEDQKIRKEYTQLRTKSPFYQTKRGIVPKMPLPKAIVRLINQKETKTDSPLSDKTAVLLIKTLKPYTYSQNNGNHNPNPLELSEETALKVIKKIKSENRLKTALQGLKIMAIPVIFLWILIFWLL
jgi:hypothetical protein